MTNPVCPETGAPMHRGVRPMTLSYKGESVTFDMPGWYCDRSEQSIHNGEDKKLSDRMLNRLKARTEGLLEPEEIKRIRKKLGLTQTAAGELIGGGPRAFQKYETGHLLPSRAISSALTLLDRDPSGLAVLKAPKRHSCRAVGPWCAASRVGRKSASAFRRSASPPLPDSSIPGHSTEDAALDRWRNALALFRPTRALAI